MEGSEGRQPGTGRTLTMDNNPYRANRPWPPDFEKLDHKHQFRLERRYRRRLRNASTRGNWIKGVKLAQYGICGGVAVYSVFFMDWGSEFGKPFEGLRLWARTAFTLSPGPPPPRLHRSDQVSTHPQSSAR